MSSRGLVEPTDPPEVALHERVRGGRCIPGMEMARRHGGAAGPAQRRVRVAPQRAAVGDAGARTSWRPRHGP